MDLLPFDVPPPEFRRRQLSDWIYQRFESDFGRMTNLPEDLRNSLQAEHGSVWPEPVRALTCDDGNTVKAVFGGGYETVAMRYPKRTTVCVSSQAGCALGCTFCATGQMGLKRHLSSWEIVQQVLWAGSVLGVKPSNIVFMGMGEPLHNYEAVLEAVRCMHTEVGISARHITISTVGLLPQMKALADFDLPVTLALSLHAPDDETRSGLVPLNKRYPVKDLMAALRAFRGSHGRRVSIEYAMIADVNDQPWQAGRLADLVRGTDIHVNLIPLNPTPGFGVPGSRRVKEFASELRAGGVNVTIRDTRGREIDAACGQLAVDTLG